MRGCKLFPLNTGHDSARPGGERRLTEVPSISRTNVSAVEQEGMKAPGVPVCIQIRQRIVLRKDFKG
jgi:hypothetical protein